MTPNDICTETATEENEGDLELMYTGSASTDDACFDPSIASVSTTSGEPTLSAVGTTYTLSVQELYTEELTVPLAQPGPLY